MFQSDTYAASNTRSLRDKLRRALALAPAPPTREALELDRPAHTGALARHPHRVPLAWLRERRPGRVAARAQPCLTALSRPRHRSY